MNTTFLLIASAAAAAGGLAYLFRSLRWLIRTLDAVLALASKELNPNGGNSLKDDMGNVVRSLDLAHRRIDDHGQRIDALTKGTP